jgi:hypothetical protein
VRRPAVGEHGPIPFDHVLVAEPRAFDVDAAGADDESVVEAGGLEVPRVRLQHQCLDPVVCRR